MCWMLPQEEKKVSFDPNKLFDDAFFAPGMHTHYRKGAEAQTMDCFVRHPETGAGCGLHMTTSCLTCTMLRIF